MTDAALTTAKVVTAQPGRGRIVRIIALKEWRELRRDRRLLWLGALFLLLMLAALAFGVSEKARLQGARQAAAKADRELWLGQQAKNPHAAAHFGQYAFKPVSPLALADPGVDAYAGTAVWLEAHKQNETQFRQARDVGVGARLGGLSLAFILQIIAPLIIILAGFAGFAGEREAGTLKQLLGVGVRPGDLLAGKALALFGATAALLAPAALFVAVAILLFGDPDKFPPADQLLRLTTLALAYAAYLAGFAFLTLGVSAWMTTTRAALIALLAFWLINSFLAPRLMTDLARTLTPTPTAQQFRADIAADKAKTFGHDETHPAFIAFRDDVLKKYGVTRVEDLPVSFRGLSLRRDDEAGYAIFDRHYGALQNAFDRQDDLRAAPGFLFPLLTIRPLSMRFAGTDSRSQFDFAAAAEAHRRVIQNAVSDHLIQFSRNGDKNYVAGPELWARIAAFAYRTPGVAAAFVGSGEMVVGLLGWLLLSFGFALVAVRRLTPV